VKLAPRVAFITVSRCCPRFKGSSRGDVGANLYIRAATDAAIRVKVSPKLALRPTTPQFVPRGPAGDNAWLTPGSVCPIQATVCRMIH
jgi:hypothetical protein